MFTQDELEAAVSKIVRTSIRRPYGALGNRQVNVTFGDMKDAAASVFILFPNSIFYVALLAGGKLVDVLDEAGTTLDNLTSSVFALSRYVTPISSITSLSNAKVALDDLSSALSARSTAFPDLESVPAFQRFDKNTQKFLSEAGGNIKSGGDIALTPEEARAQLGSLLSDLAEIHSEIVGRMASLATSVDNFSALNLPGLMASSIITNARDVLVDHIDELDALTPDERLGVLREVTLDVLAARATVRGFGNVKSPTTFLDIDGTGSVFADASHFATPAVLTTIHAPFNVITFILSGVGNILDFIVDGDSTSVPMLGSFVAKIEGTIKEPYDIGHPNTDGLNTDILTVDLHHYPGVSNTTSYIFDHFTPNVAMTAYEVCTTINSDLVGSPLLAEPYANPLKFFGNVNIDTTGVPNDVQLTSTNPSTNFTTLVAIGDRLIVRSPGAHYGRVYQIITLSALILNCNAVGASPIVADELDKTIEVSGGNMAIRFRIADPRDITHIDYRLQALQDRTSIFFPDVDENRYALALYGFIPLMEAVSQPSSASDIVKAFGLSSSTSIAGKPRISASTVFDPYIYIGTGRSEPSIQGRVVVSKLLDSGAVTSGTNIVVSINGAPDAGVIVGDILIIRSHPDTPSVGVKGTITSLDATSIHVTMDTPITSATATVEVGPNLNLPFDAVLTISGNTFNDGVYTIKSSRAFDLDVLPVLSLINDVGNQSLSFSVSIGLFKVAFASLDTTLDTSLEVVNVSPGNAITQFFPGPTSAVGSTLFIKMPSIPKDLELGDIFELYTSQFDEPSFEASIISIDTELKIIELSAGLPTNTAPFTFSQNVSVPFARVRKNSFNNYSSFKSALLELLAQPWASESALKELNRLSNAVLVNKNPTVVQIEDVVSQIEIFTTGIDDLRAVVSGYTADVVHPIDALLKSFSERGSERAVDFLLQAKVSEFFGLSQDDSSYAGSLQNAIREVQKNDLPIRKTGRTGPALAAMGTIASFDDVNFDFDLSDVDTSAEPDIPGAQGIPFPGQSF